MRVVSWNVKGASKDNKVWDYLLALQPDVALLQEVGEISVEASREFNCLMRPATAKDGRKQRFHTGVVAKGKIVAEIGLLSDRAWVNEELELLSGNFVGCTVRLSDGTETHVVSVHSPHWPVDEARLVGIDISQLRTSDPKLWGTDLLWYALKAMATCSNWIVGGDFNSSETFDREWKERNGVRGGLSSSGNAQMLRRMRGLGFTDCLRKSEHDPIIPTFRYRDNTITHQIDHLFVSNNLMSGFGQCIAGDRETVFGGYLSDHLPIIADFGAGQPAETRGVMLPRPADEKEKAIAPASVYTAVFTGDGITTIFENGTAVAQLRKGFTGYRVIPDNRIHRTWRPSTKAWEDGHKAVASYFNDKTLTGAVKELLASSVAPVTERVVWRSAVTYPDAPHEYVLRDQYPQAYALYQERIAQDGRDEKYTLRGRTASYRYYYGDDGYKYWILDEVLNRVSRETGLEEKTASTRAFPQGSGPQRLIEEDCTSSSADNVVGHIALSPQTAADPAVFCDKHPGTQLICRRCEGAKGGRTTKALRGDKAAEWGRKGGKLGGRPKKSQREDLKKPSQAPKTKAGQSEILPDVSAH
jgi:exonuclease III